MYNKVEICGVNTATLKVLTEAEKIRLLREMREGNQRARDELVQGNLRLVLSVVQRFAGRGENPDDLFQVGCIGLIKSIDNFDLSQNVRFSTYAVPMIIGEIHFLQTQPMRQPLTSNPLAPVYHVLKTCQIKHHDKQPRAWIFDSNALHLFGLPLHETV